jgi:hypothetical protein
VRENRLSADRPVKTGKDQFAAAQLPSADDEVIQVKPQNSDMGREEAARILGVQPDADENIVEAVAREKIKSDHPDHGGSGDMEELKEARKTLLEDNE